MENKQKEKKIAVISHVNPFSKGSGQIQRVYNTVLALASQWENLSIYTIDTNTVNDRITHLKSINPNVEIIFVKKPAFLKYMSPIFHFLFYLGFGKPSNWQIPLIFSQIEKQIKEQKYDIVLFEYWHLYKLASKLKSASNIIVCDTHNILLNTFEVLMNNKKKIPEFYKKFLIKKYKKLEFNKALTSFDLLLAINKEEEKELQTYFPQKNIYYFPMGVKLPESNIDIEKKIDFPKKNYTIVYYGGLGNEKNTKDAIRVIDEVKKINSNQPIIQYKIIGSKPPQYLQELAHKTPNVELMGFVENLADAFNNVDLAVIPFSGKYGFRSRLIEIMYYGVPVMTTEDAVWGMGFSHNEDIFLFNDKKDFSEYLLELLRNRALRKKIALKAKEKVNQEFTFENTYVKFAKSLKKIISK